MKEHYHIRPYTVELLAGLMAPLRERGIISGEEEVEIVENLKALSRTGTYIRDVSPKMISQQQAAELLGIGYSSFKRLEIDGEFPFKRRLFGSAVRYLNLDIYEYMYKPVK